MRVAVVTATNGGLSGGYRKYLAELLPLLRREPSIENLELYVPQAAGIGGGEGVRAFSPADAWLGFRGLRREVLSRRPDVAFVPTARDIDLSPVPTVVMLRNMEPLVKPVSGQSARAALSNLLRAASARRAVARAARVIAVSEFVRDYLVQRWRVPPGKIDLVPHGVAPPTTVPRAPAGLAGLASPFLFTAGSIRPARGLEDAIQALARLNARGPRRAFVIAGASDPDSAGYERRMKRLVARLGLSGDVAFAGHLTSPEMSWAFREAELFVMTSRTEACPNLVLEAMAHGCVSVSTDSPPMPEFYGDSALYYTEGDPAALAAAVERALALTVEEKRALAARALARSRRFTWEEHASETARVLERTARESGGGEGRP